MSQQDIYAAKNARVKKALEAKTPYWLLISEGGDRRDWWLALIQVGNDRIPLPVALGLFGVDFEGWNEYSPLKNVFGYEPEITFDRNLVTETSVGSLLADIVDYMLASGKDQGDGLPAYEVSKDGQWASICTRYSRNPGLNRNGGDYDYYRRYRVLSSGVFAGEDWSADFELQHPDEKLFRIDITNLTQIFEQAANVVRALNEGQKTVVCPCCALPYTHPQDEGAAD